MDINIGGTNHKKDWLLGTIAGQDLLKGFKVGSTRPRCMCVPTGNDMYIATRGALHYLARMPGTGDSHSEDCRSHIVPSTLYSVDTPQKILTSLLQGIPDIKKSKWNDLRMHIMSRAANITIDGEALKDRLLVPTFFIKERADFQRARYEKFIVDGSSEEATRRRWVVAVIKDAAPSKYGARLSFKQMSSFVFWAGKDLAPHLLDACTTVETILPTIALGLFEVKKSSSGVTIVDCALHLIQERGDAAAEIPATVMPVVMPVPETEEDKLIEVCTFLGLPSTTARREVISAMIDFCVEHARKK